MSRSPTDEVNVDFLTTRWSIVLNAGDSRADEAQNEALERLCVDYWYPLYAFLRRGGKNQEDARDLTQGFFERFLMRKDFKRADKGKGRFRSYLLSALKNYAANEWRKEHRQKRGGEAQRIPIDPDLENRYGREPEDTATPEALFQRSWATSLLDIVRAKLEQEFAGAGKTELFDSLQEYLGGSGGDTASYLEVAEKHGLSVGAVTMSVRRMRQRYGTLLRQEIAETVAGPEEIDDEIRFLMGVLANR